MERFSEVDHLTTFTPLQTWAMIGSIVIVIYLAYRMVNQPRPHIEAPYHDEPLVFIACEQCMRTRGCIRGAWIDPQSACELTPEFIHEDVPHMLRGDGIFRHARLVCVAVNNQVSPEAIGHIPYSVAVIHESKGMRSEFNGEIF